MSLLAWIRLAAVSVVPAAGRQLRGDCGWRAAGGTTGGWARGARLGGVRGGAPPAPATTGASAPGMR